MAVRGFTEFNEDRCKGCELCVSVCPKGLIKISESAVNSKGYHPACVENTDGCIACANCALICPDGAISVWKE